MDRKETMEQYVADAIAEKPLQFSITRMVEVDTERTEEGRRPLRYLPFIRRKVQFQVFAKEKKPKVFYYSINPPTLGKMQILSNLYLELEINDKDLNDNPTTTMMEICAKKTDTCARMMAVATLSTKGEVLDDKLIAERADIFKWACSPDDMAKVIVALISHSHYGNFLNSIALTKILRQNEPIPTTGETGAIE